jgi:hypothetical protein
MAIKESLRARERTVLASTSRCEADAIGSSMFADESTV